MLSTEPSLFDACSEALQQAWGSIERESAVFPWRNTDYYRNELGSEILRKFLFFSSIADPAVLPLLKRLTNSLEKEHAVYRAGLMRRCINLDPGYVTEAKVVLATTKDFSHRVYIGEGIYAEATLRYDAKKRSFLPHEVTYPDFRTEPYLMLFNEARERLRFALKARSAER